MSPQTATRLTRWWANLYTIGLPQEQRNRRQAELESDLWESLADRNASRQILARLVRGIFDDLIWSTGQMERTVRESLWWSFGSVLAVSSVVLWITYTPDGEAMRNSLWAWPLTTILHVLGFVAFIGLRAVIDLRLTSRVFGTVPVSSLMRKLMPATIIAAVLSIATGLALYIADPALFLTNPLFRIKLAVLAIALLNVWYLHAVTFRTVERWDTAPAAPTAARVGGFLSLMLWATIIVMAMLVPYFR